MLNPADGLSTRSLNETENVAVNHMYGLTIMASCLVGMKNTIESADLVTTVVRIFWVSEDCSKQNYYGMRESRIIS